MNYWENVLGTGGGSNDKDWSVSVVGGTELVITSYARVYGTVWRESDVVVLIRRR